jgi:NADPH-dependent 2,4-dienoyl-CoA reductase/sulfur reductase-like enzyme
MESSVPGIYAAGDVAQVVDPLTGKSQLDALWSVAVAQGRIAGANMAGVPTVYRRTAPANVTRLASLPVTIVGAVGTGREADEDLLTISRGDSEVWRGVPGVLMIYDQKDVNRQRLVLKDGRLIGAVLLGDQSLAPIVRRLIAAQVDVGPYLPTVQSPHVNLAEALRRIPLTTHPPAGL